MNITVIALGKVGLPVAALYAARGHRVTGCDLSPAVVNAVNAGVSTLPHEPGLAERLAAVVSSGQLTATTDTVVGVVGAEVVIVLVPLDVDAAHQPDFRSMDGAFQTIASALKPGTLVILETTVPVGTCRSRYLPVFEQGGRRCGVDFFFAFSPERLQAGRVERDLDTYPRVVGGIDAASAARAAAFYAGNFTVPVITLDSAEAAEMCKLAESIYRDVNIALANELAAYAAARGIDFMQVIKAANSQPQSHLHRPGLGVGGHCIPVYPYFLLNDAETAALTLHARRVNDGQHRLAADQIEAALGGLSGRRVLILGLTYRTGVKETAHSPALDLAAELRQRGAITLGHDPLLAVDEIAAAGLTSVDLGRPVSADAVVLHTDDPTYLDFDASTVAGCAVVLDCAGAWDPARVTARGITYLALGRPARRPPVSEARP